MFFQAAHKGPRSAPKTGYAARERIIDLRKQNCSVYDIQRALEESGKSLSPAAIAPQLIGRYAQRLIIENGIADSIDFFHMDALSSAVAMKVDCDLAHVDDQQPL